jgi:ribosomal protein L22
VIDEKRDEETPEEETAPEAAAADEATPESEAAAEEAPAKKPRRRAKKKAEPVAEEPVAEEEAPDEEPADDADAPEEEAAEEPEAEEDAEKPAPRRRRRRKAADEEAEEPAPQPKTPAPVGRDGLPSVRARAKYVRTSARKARLVGDHVRGKSVDEARAILALSPRSVARDWSKVLESAIANAEHNHELVGDDLKLAEVYADEGPTLKRYRPRAMGRATRIRKRTSHLTITLSPKE